MDAKTHWEKVYATKAPEAVSWYRPHLETSLALIERAAAGYSSSIIDVGGGESTLVDDLLARGYENITVLDVSQTAIDVTKKRLGLTAEQVHWLVADVTDAQLERGSLRRVARPRSVSFSYRKRASCCVCSTGRPRRQAWWSRNRQHLRTRRSHKMQWARRYSL